LQSDTAFNAFIYSLVAKIYPIKELHASTHSISRKASHAPEMHDKGLIERITLLVVIA
jgi:hypothetical protein